MRHPVVLFAGLGIQLDRFHPARCDELGDHIGHQFTQEHMGFAGEGRERVSRAQLDTPLCNGSSRVDAGIYEVDRDPQRVAIVEGPGDHVDPAIRGEQPGVGVVDSDARNGDDMPL